MSQPLTGDRQGVPLSSFRLGQPLAHFRRGPPAVDPRVRAFLASSPTVTPAFVDFVAAHEIERGDPERPVVALTFDCGGGEELTERILATLERYDARATFFLEGNLVRLCPELVGRIVAGGHELGNHSATHPDFTTLSQREVADEIRSVAEVTAAALFEQRILGPTRIRFFRFPYGTRDAEALRRVAALGYQSVFWSVDPQGWRSDVTAEEVAAFVLDNAGPGDILIQHCTSRADVQALPAIIRGLRAGGLEVGPLSAVVNVEDLPLPENLDPAAVDAARETPAS